MIKEMLDIQGKLPYTHIVVPVNSGITLAGVLVAKAMLRLPTKIIAFNATNPIPITETRIDRVIGQFNITYGCNYSAGLFTLSDDYVGPEGPGIAYPEEIYWVQRLARLEGIFLDPIVTGKAFYGLMDQTHKKAFAPTDHILFLHTGGPFALLSHRHLFTFPSQNLDPALLLAPGEDLAEGGGEREKFELSVEEEEDSGDHSIQFIK